MTRWPAAVLAASSVTGALGCTVVAVGKDASATGHPLVAHTDDSGAATSDIRLVRVPRKTWPEGSTRKLYPWKLGRPCWPARYMTGYLQKLRATFRVFLFSQFCCGGFSATSVELVRWFLLC